MKHIFLAEDNPADVYLLREALTGHDGEVTLTVVRDGEEAMNYIHRRGAYANAGVPDLMVLDLNLPKSDGGDVLRSIRASEELKDVPVVILTSSDSPRDRNALEKLGASCYITKPSDLDTFMELGRTLLDVTDGKLPPK